jgi:hypothetical protein
MPQDARPWTPATRTAVGDPSTTTRGAIGATPAPRRIHRARARLPSGRAVVGGLLVAVAVVATFALASHHGEADGHVVVARHAIGIGDRLTAADVRIAHVDLPPELAAHLFRDGADVEGLRARTALAAGDVVQRSALSAPGAEADAEVSFPLDAARALNGLLEPGELVTVLATYGTGEAARTLVVARSVRLVDIATPESAITSAGKVVVTLAVPDPDELLATAHAGTVATMTLVRADRRSPPGADAYSLPGITRSTNP